MEFKNKFILSNEYLNLADLKPKAEDPLLWDDYRPRTWVQEEVSDEGFLVLKPEKPEYQLAYNAFYIESDGLYTYSCEVESPQMFEIFLNGKKIGSNYIVSEEDTTSKKTASLKLDRGKFLVLVKSMYLKGDKNKWEIIFLVYRIIGFNSFLSTVLVSCFLLVLENNLQVVPQHNQLKLSSPNSNSII